MSDTDDLSEQEIVDILELVDVSLAVAEVSKWTPSQRVEAVRWATYEAYRRDLIEDLEVPPKPSWLVRGV